ncbi:Imm26 family immunity protein [Sphingopyxis microcysteis]|uniref:Imm26 family immunity protein n=1 Tax=Sphingopyxis microcysteis TaxID=2484145 RepID=UPI0014464113|nr:Imm26 family immunity protein [Sphingopyxis microcysteis]
MLNRKRRRKPGQILKIDLGAGIYALGIVLDEPLIAFFDQEFKEASAYEVERLPVAFILMVMNNAVTSGRWDVLGMQNIPDRLSDKPKFCKQDPISGDLSIYQEIDELAPHFERPAEPGECEGLETAAVWEAEHVEDRLRDHFAGRENEWEKQLRIQGSVST